MRASLSHLARSASNNWRSRLPQSSYYKDSKFSPALQRARRGYLLPNAITGICIFGFAIGVYSYTINIVNQDEFEDVPIPDGPAPSAGPPHASANKSAGGTAVGT